MTIATDAQVQVYSDTTVRPISEQFRNLYNTCKSAKAQIDDIYSNVTQQSPTWVDGRGDNPPHLLTPADVLAWNAFVSAFIDLIESGQVSNYPILLKACVRAF